MDNHSKNSEYDFIRELAERYNVKFRIELLEEGVRGYKIGVEIVLNSENPPERRNWTFCHELGHIVLGHSTTPSDEDEREADRFAAETMLPERDFIPDSADMDLHKLKEIYPHASFEAITRRCLQFNPGIASIFDGGELVFRVGSEGVVFPAKPAAVEKNAVAKCLNDKKDVSVCMDGMDINAYYIDMDRQVIRVILITRPFSYYE